MSEENIMIIRALADNNLNVTKTARQVHYHRNTIVYRVELIKREFGLDPLKFYDLIKLLKIADSEGC